MTYETNQVQAIIASITTKMVAKYLYKAILEISNEYNIECVDDIENYLENTIDALSRYDYYHAVLDNTYRNIRCLGYDYFDDEEAIKKRAKEWNLCILTDKLLVDYVANESSACETVFEMLENGYSYSECEEYLYEE